MSHTPPSSGTNAFLKILHFGRDIGTSSCTPLLGFRRLYILDLKTDWSPYMPERDTMEQRGDWKPDFKASS